MDGNKLSKAWVANSQMLVCAWNYCGQESHPKVFKEDEHSGEQSGKGTEQHRRISVKHQLKYWQRPSN